MSDELADVVALFPLAEEGDDAHPVLPDPTAVYACIHRDTRLDRAARRVYCRKCGREVEAYAVLEALAHDSSRYIGAREEAKRQAELAQARLEELLRRERNAKARLRRADPPPPAPTGGKVYRA